MSILFSVIANNKNIINAYASCDGNFLDIVSEVLLKRPSKPDKMTYLHGKYLINYIVDNDHVYLCVTDKACQRSRAFLFLNEIKRGFKMKNKDYTNILAAEMLRYSQDYNNIVIQDGALDEINRIEVECSETILGEKILMVQHEDNLEFSTMSYVGRSPEKIIVSVESTNSRIILGMALILTVVIMCIFGPATFVAVIGIFFYLAKRKT
ncbi:PREDICTED: vesicle-associated membrane protein 7-like [Papilio polytes]|uniref:vesicle-associated membrane protein 7-like n=1 Tax=Papilio polytes TaxID=76194 RepID=UPI0006763D59|nr:PREDICTED: vesicle-associated membrane protein 7-like [Papilio polytes]